MRTLSILVAFLISACTTVPTTVGQAERQIDFRRCRVIEIKRLGWANQPKGDVEIEYTVDPRGNLKGTKVLSNTTGNKNLEDCLLGLIRSTNWPAMGGKEDIVSKYGISAYPCEAGNCP